MFPQFCRDFIHCWQCHHTHFVLRTQLASAAGTFYACTPLQSITEMKQIIHC